MGVRAGDIVLIERCEEDLHGCLVEGVKHNHVLLRDQEGELHEWYFQGAVRDGELLDPSELGILTREAVASWRDEALQPRQARVAALEAVLKFLPRARRGEDEALSDGRGMVEHSLTKAREDLRGRVRHHDWVDEEMRKGVKFFSRSKVPSFLRGL